MAYFVALQHNDSKLQSELDIYCAREVKNMDVSHRCHDSACVDATHLLEPHQQNLARAPCKGKQGILRAEWVSVRTEEMWVNQGNRYHKGKPCIY